MGFLLFLLFGIVGINGATFTYTGTSYNVGSQDTTPNGLDWDGTNFFMVGDTGNDINKYSSSWSYISNHASGIDTQPRDIYWNGTNFLLLGDNSNNIIELESDLTLGSSNYSTGRSIPAGIFKKGSNYYITDALTDRVYEYDSSFTYTTNNWDIANSDSWVRDLYWDGTYWFFVFNNVGSVERYDSSFNYIESYDVSSEDGAPTGITSDGTYFYISGDSNNYIYQYELSFNSAPTNNSVTITPTIAYTNNTLQGYGNFSDSDGDNLTYEYIWYNNDNNIFSNNGLVSYYKAENDSTDSYSDNDGTWTGTEAYVSSVNSNYGNAFNSILTGTILPAQDYITFDTPINLSGEMTISFWAKLNSWNNTYSDYRKNRQSITGNNLNDVNSYIIFEDYSGDSTQRRVCMEDIDGNSDCTSNRVITLGEWVNVVVKKTMPSGKLYWYINGEYDSEGGALTGEQYFEYLLRGYADTGFNGSIDDFRIYNRSLSATEISTLYNLNQSEPSYTENINTNIVNLSSTDIDKNDEIVFSVRANDGTIWSDWINSTTLTISNLAPIVNSVNISPTTAYTNSILTFVNSTTDNDADSITQWSIQWYKNNILQSSLNNETSISSGNLTKGDSWNVSLSAYDGTSWSNTLISNAITISNSIPVVNSVNISPSNPNYLNNLTFTNSTTDNDIDSLSYDIRWYLNGVLNSSYNNISTITTDNHSIGQNWTISLRANDGTDWSEWVNSSQITIIDNISPTLSNDSLSASSGVFTDPFIINVDVLDVSTLSFIKVEITDPNAVATNYTMTLQSGNTYTKTIVPNGDLHGYYDFKFYVGDIYSNNASLDSSLRFRHYDGDTGTTGGGSSSDVPIDDNICKIEFNPIKIKLTDGFLSQDLEIFNMFTTAYQPQVKLNYVDGDKELFDYIRISDVPSIINGDSSKIMTVKMYKSVLPQGMMRAEIIFSDELCGNVIVPIEVEINNTQPKTLMLAIKDLFNDVNLTKYFEMKITDKFDVESPNLAQKIMNNLFSVAGLSIILSLGVLIWLILSKSFYTSIIADIGFKTLSWALISTIVFVILYYVHYMFV